MKLPTNEFKRALLQGRSQIGLWGSLVDPSVAEIVGGAGFDWLLVDTEHTPADLGAVLSVLRVIDPSPTSPVVRPPSNDPVVIKRLLDIGVQTFLVPQVNSADDAREAVAALHYPPTGVRGVAASTRASGYGRVEGYATRAADELCLLVQIESVEALDHLDDIVAVAGVHGFFVGPGDLAASMGHVGELTHPDVVAAVEDAIRRVVAAGRPAGVLTSDPAIVRRCLSLGTTFTAVGSDIAVLARGVERLAQEHRPAD